MMTFIGNNGRFIKSGVILLRNLEYSGHVEYLYITGTSFHISNNSMGFIQGFTLPIYDKRVK
jgi:hypothetical protein